MHDHTSYAELPPVAIAYGMDIGDGFAVLVRATRSGSSTSWEQLAHVSGAEINDDVVAALERARAETTLRQALLAAALPVSDSSVRWLTAPFPSLNKARKVFPSLLDIQLPFPVESCVYGFPLMETTGAGQVKGLAVAARRETIERRIQACATRHADPQILDHEGLALWDQSLRERPATDESFRLITYLGSDRTVWVAGIGNRFLSAHATRSGVTALKQADADNAAVREWRDRALRVVRAAPPADAQHAMTCLWTGPGAADAELYASLQTQLDAVAAIQHHTLDAPESFLARALALRALTRPPWFWNYRFGPLAHPLVQEMKGNAVRRTGWTLLAAGLVLVMLNLAYGQLLQARHQNADRVLNQTARAITGLPMVPRGQEVIVVDRAIEEQEQTLAPFHSALQPGQLARLRTLLEMAATHHLSYDSIAFRTDQWLIQGTADDWDRCETLAQYLRQEGWIVQLDRQDAIAEEHVRFRITARSNT